MNGEVLPRLLERRPLGPQEVRGTFDEMVSRSTPDTVRAALLVALAARRHPTAEVVAFAREMRRRAVPFRVASSDGAVDLCGSGGAAHPSFNVSTVSAFVVRAAGVSVVKHGNRSRTVCGSSDLLDALGLPVFASIPFARASYRRYGLAFLHAPLFHPETRSVAAVRRQLSIPTIFNRLGPLSNPARVRYQVTGAVDLETAARTASMLRSLGVSEGLAMTSDEGCDEFSPRRPTTAVRWGRTRTQRFRVHPETYLDPEDRRGSWGPLPPAAAAEETERILAGGGGARRGSVLLTSGAALWISGRAPDLAAGIEKARDALDQGLAEELLRDLGALAGNYSQKERP